MNMEVSSLSPRHVCICKTQELSNWLDWNEFNFSQSAKFIQYNKFHIFQCGKKIVMEVAVADTS